VIILKLLLVEQKNNSKVFLRPRFSLEVGKSKEEAISAIERELVYLKKDYKYKISDHHIFIDVSEKDSHFWSPHLHIEIVTNDQTSSTIKGLFSPKPQVWTFFMFLHFVIGVSFLAFLMMLYVYNSLDKNIIFPLMMVIFLPIFWFTLYFVGRIGRDLGMKQMQKLHEFLLNCFV